MKQLPETIGAALRATANRYPDRTAVVSEQKRITFKALDQDADSLARALQELGVGPSDHVAILMTNDLEWGLVWMAVVRLGAVLVPINTRYRKEEVAYILRQSDAKVLFTMDRYWNTDYLAMIREIVPDLGGADQPIHSSELPALRAVIAWRDQSNRGVENIQDMLARGRRLDTALPSVDPAGGAIIVYTSGTTGFPKGAMHSHIILQNVANIARALRIEPGDAILGHMPFYHVAGTCTELLPTILLGGTLVTMPQWKPDVALDLIAAERIAIFGGIPTHFIDCIDQIRRQPRDTSCLKSAWIGGATVTPDVARAARDELHIRSLQAVYGMTETTSTTTLSDFDDPIEVVCENKGKPIGDFEVVVFDPVQNVPVPAGAVGEVRVRGHLVMMGYYKNPEATAEVMTPDGWFRTGDLGVFDEQGYLKITGRLKEMFIVGGSNAYPAEIERMLQTHPKIKQAVVVGVPDARLGEVGLAYVQTEAGSELTEREVIDFCKSLMADYKVPRHVRVVQVFPLTSTGKIQRGELAKSAVQSLERDRMPQR